MAWTGWQTSSSSVVERYRYDDLREILQIRSRRSGRVREYDCTPSEYDEFVRSPSQGRYLALLAPRVKRRWRLRPLTS